MTYIVSIKVLSMTEEYKELLWILVVLHFISDQNLCSFNKKKKKTTSVTWDGNFLTGNTHLNFRKI